MTAMAVSQTSPPTRYAVSPDPRSPGVLVHQASNLDVLRAMPAESVSSVVTDPPYGLSDHSPDEVIQALTAWAQGDRERVPDGRGFMGNQWDRFVPPPAVWDECMRVLKPGGHMAVFAGSRTADLMGLSIRMAGFEMRDTINWIYSSGFPKSLDVGKAIYKAAGATRKVVGYDKSRARPNRLYESGAIGNIGGNGKVSDRTDNGATITAPATVAAAQWDGWGTALKPAGEPIIVARKPIKGTVAANVLAHGTGGMNIKGCETPEGRWPANVALSHAMTPDGSDACADGCVDGCAVKVLDGQSGILTSGLLRPEHQRTTAGGNGITMSHMTGQSSLTYGDSGGASRFYNVFRYQAKAPKSERPIIDGMAHPTVKPLALMEWLVTLFTPPGGVVGDWFAGTGTTGQAAMRLGFGAILTEDDPRWWPLLDQRLNKCLIDLFQKAV